jgi:magnesium chelatase subunit H
MSLHPPQNKKTMPCLVMQAMADQGSGGAFEISQRMTAMIGWGATTGFAEKWVFDQAADTYALDQDMADKLCK